jgi:hypothetical protein
LKENFDNFHRITGYNLESFFERFSNFISLYSGNIINYYDGGSLSNQSFNELEYLLKESKKISPLFEQYGQNFTFLGFWELLDKFTEIQTSLYTFENMGRWMRSSRLNRFDSGVKVDRKIRQGETIELIAEETGHISPQDDWVGLSINNQLTEEEYTSDGGKIISIVFQNNANFDIDNIIDSLSGKNILGKDIKRKINFINNDLETVEYEDAIFQTLNTILGTVKGSIPEFKEDGIDSEMVGTNVSTIQYPSMFRSLLSMFQKDGRWTEIGLLDLKREEDNVFMKLECKTILQDSIVTNIPI